MAVYIQQEIAALRASLTTISGNLLDLAETESVKLARARLKDGGFAGATRASAARAVASLDALWNSYLLLARVLVEACDLHQRDSIFRDTGDEVRLLLEGKSVALRAEHIPIATRELLSNASQVTLAKPQEVLAEMASQFAAARDALHAIALATADGAARLAALRRQTAQLAAEFDAQFDARLDAQLREAGAGLPAQAGLDAMLDDIERDPLSCAEALAEAEQALEAERLRLRHLEQQRALSRAALERAGATLAQLRECVRLDAAAIEETRRTMHEPAQPVAPIDADAIESLGAWLATIERAGRHEAIIIGLARWQGACEAQLAAARAACAANRRQLDESIEIAGRFQALRAKADALAARGAQWQADLPALQRAVKQALQARPLHLAALRAAIGAYETALYTHQSSAR
ncbi:chromosome segregation ATPase [Oxalobacteraceae bacterium GrIS 1.11]